MDPLNYEPLYSLGRYYESTRNDFAGALDFFDKAIQLEPHHSKSVYYQGYCLEMLGRRDEARGTYEKAIEVVEKNRETFSLPYQGMARLLLDLDAGRALHFARKAVELEPNLDSNHSELARVYERLGKLIDAIREVQAAVRLSPNKSSQHYILSRLYNRLGNPQAAQAELQIFQKVNAIYGSQ
jgi:tetratricopeptide (TPR) repeat protein